ncbi:phosphoglycerate mutase family protein [Histomonas meleagridis]|uniref:phosphoglycerate mutase family protein n=1 Tax=Histomonas meleagridis TaxID=135588 RepID=UPI003559E607|nr:phosphoglycerate mutase family protein [Histomonas meleagridis]KAH0801110.1 phosphoglycerate mutase family protein [Histomonas meleagridis]
MLSSKSFRNYTQQRGNIYLPVDLLIVRNGASEGSVMLQKRKAQKDPDFDQKYHETLGKVHNSKWRLTKLGTIQSRAAGRWISENFPHFDAYLTSEFVRSLETACCLNLDGAHWLPSLYLRPRDFGNFSRLDQNISQEQFKRYMLERARDSFYWAPPNGESIAHLTLRTERVVYWLRRHVPAHGSAIIVTHKDVMESFRIRIEKISEMDYKSMIMEPSQNHVLHYSSILHYTRRNPKTGEVVPYYQWMRIVTPWLGKHYTPNEFEPIVSKHYGNAELLAEVSNVPRIFSDE